MMVRNDDVTIRANVGANSDPYKLGVNLANAATPDEWHNLAMVLDADQGRIFGYLDGLGSGDSGTENGWAVGGLGGKVNEFSGDWDIDTGSPLRLGYYDIDCDIQFDDFAIWNRALSATEITAISSGTSVVPEPTGILLLLSGFAGCLMLRKRI